MTSMLPNKSDLAVYISSCDRYSDLWAPCIQLLGKHWSDCPYEIFLGCDQLADSFDGVTVLRAGAGKTWSGAIRAHLTQLSHRWVLVMLDDFWLRRRISSARIEHLRGQMVACGAAMLRLNPRPGGRDDISGIKGVRICDLESEYAICLQAAIWDRSVLLELLCDDESAWDFEARARIRARDTDRRFLCTVNNEWPSGSGIFHHVVEKGCWIPTERLYFRICHGQKIVSLRPTLSWKALVGLLVAETSNRVLRTIFGHSASFVRKRLLQLLPLPLTRRYRKMRGYKISDERT